MIGIKCAAGWLDLLPGSIGIELSNPFFRYDTVPGITTYPFGLPMTPGNLRALNFPHLVAAQGLAVPAEPVEFYLDGLLWRLGSLTYQEHQPERHVLQYQFVAGAGDLQARIQDLKLSAQDFGVQPLVLTHEAPDYALGTVKNLSFYGDQTPPYSGYLNRYQGGAYDPSSVAPQPRLVPLLRRALAQVGYTVSGDWLTDATTRQLVLYGDRIADDLVQPVAPFIALQEHVPAELTPGQLLLGLQQLFGLGYDFNPARRELRITRLREVATNPEYVGREAGQLTRATPPLLEGYTLSLELEKDDALSKTQDTSWTRLVVGGGKTELKSEAGTLHCFGDAASGQLLPQVEKKGTGRTQFLNETSQTGLRLLFDRGLQSGPAGLYPLSSNGREQGSPLALAWAGANGLYAQCHQPWLEFLGRAGSEERLVPFRIGDLLSLDPARKELLGPRKYLWEKVSLSVRTDKRLETARITYRNIRL